jgi:hypothetical protein
MIAAPAVCLRETVRRLSQEWKARQHTVHRAQEGPNSEIRNQKSEIRNQKSNQTEPGRTTFRELQVENQEPKAKNLELKTKN